MNTATIITTEVRIIGMSCSHCEHAVSAALLELPGVTRVSVDVAAGTTAVDSNDVLDPMRVAAAVDAAGYDTEWSS
jgi:copper chaperone CopZ